jgi:hypothetical protein
MDPDSVREQIEMDERWEQVRHRHRFFGVVVILLALAIAGLAWFFYPMIQRHEATLAQFPGVQKTVDGFGDQMKAADSKLDSKLADWSTRQEQLRGRMDQATRDLRTRIEAARKQTSEASTALFERIQSEVANQVDGIKTRLASLETSRDSDRTQIAGLQQELGQVRSQLADQAKELATVRGQVDQNAAATDRQLAGVKENQQHDRRDFDAFTDKVAMRRVDFEVSKHHSRELAPGISLGVDGTDVSYQRISGWVWVMPDKKTIWLRQQRTQDPVVLSNTPDGRKRELVITSVAKDSVVGYVVVPAASIATTTAAAQSDSSASEVN